MKLNNNDDSHNSGLNLLIYNMLLDIESHPTWVCGLKLHAHSRREFLTILLVIMSLARKLSVSFTKNSGSFSIVVVIRVSKLVSY